MKLFISYAHDDEYLVRSQVVEILRAAGHDPWFDHDLIVGADWKQQLLDAISACDAFVYALTPEGAHSEWCQWEFSQAIALGKPIIPILLQKTPLPPILSNIQYVDFTQGATGQATAKLMGGLTAIQVHIPREQVPLAPTSPRGQPARVRSPVDSPSPPARHGRLIGLIVAFGIVVTLGIASQIIPNSRTNDPSPQPTITASPDPTSTEVLRPTTDHTQAAASIGSSTAAAATPSPTPTTTRQPLTATPTAHSPTPETPEPPITDACYAVAINDSGVNDAIMPLVREEPSKTAAIIASIRASQQYPVIDRAAFGRDVWYQLADNESRPLGWVSALYITVEGNCTFNQQ